MDVARWLQDRGLPDYAVLFREQAIDADMLLSLTDADFEKLGLPRGHRKKLLTAIAALQVAPSSSASIRRSSPQSALGQNDANDPNGHRSRRQCARLKT
jgi:SAM domain (Sterile alpha motif)